MEPHTEYNHKNNKTLSQIVWGWLELHPEYKLNYAHSANNENYLIC